MKRKRNLYAYAFILLEVLVSLAILGVAISMALKSITNSLKAVTYSQQITQGTMLARGLIDQWEIEPPEEGETRGNFGENYADYFYLVLYEPEEIDYENVSRRDTVTRLAYFHQIHLTVYFQHGESAKRKKLLKIHTALIASERFNSISRLVNEIGFEQ